MKKNLHLLFITKFPFFPLQKTIKCIKYIYIYARIHVNGLIRRVITPLNELIIKSHPLSKPPDHSRIVRVHCRETFPRAVRHVFRASRTRARMYFWYKFTKTKLHNISTCVRINT